MFLKHIYQKKKCHFAITAQPIYDINATLIQAMNVSFPYYIAFCNFRLYASGNFHLMNIDLPTGAGAPPLDTQLPLLLSHYPFRVFLFLCLSLLSICPCPYVPVCFHVSLSWKFSPNEHRFASWYWYTPT